MNLSEREDQGHTARVPVAAGDLGSAGAPARPEVCQAQFTEWYANHHRAVFHYVARTFDRHMAEDITAATFTEAWRSRHTFDPEVGIPIRWLLGIATNLVKQQLRVRTRQSHWLIARSEDQKEVTGFIDERPSAVEVLERREILQFVRDELDREDPATRQMVYLLAVDEMSYQEIAETLGIPVGTVRSRLSRFRGRLNVRMTGQGMQQTKHTTAADDPGGPSDG